MSELKNLYYLGPNGSNSYNAADKFIDICGVSGVLRSPEKSIKSVISAVTDNKTSIAVLPIENSIEGIVRETIDSLAAMNNLDVKIQGEFVLPVKHMLLSKTGEASKINKIYSHPQALAQCSRYLYSHFPDAELKEVSSTSFAAEKIASENDETAAAIANEACAGIFGLNIAAYDINDELDNRTRFYILGRTPFYKSGKNKTSVILSPKVNRPGVLCDILKIFAKNYINLSCIDSRPSKKHLGEYLFFIELDCSIDEAGAKQAFSELKIYTEFLKILGSFSIYGYQAA